MLMDILKTNYLGKSVEVTKFYTDDPSDIQHVIIHFADGSELNIFVNPKVPYHLLDGNQDIADFAKVQLANQWLSDLLEELNANAWDQEIGIPCGL